jgi:hypothetical protein
MRGVGVDPRQAGDLAVDTGLFLGLADPGMRQRLAEVHGAAGQCPVPVVSAADQQDLTRIVGHHHIG